MATSQQRFDDVCEDIIRKEPPFTWDISRDAIISMHYYENAFAKAKSKHTFMNEYDFEDFFRFTLTGRAKKAMEIYKQPIPKPEEFWDAAYAYDGASPGGSLRLKELTHPCRLGVIPLGRLYDDKGPLLGLEPRMGALVGSDFEEENYTRLPYAATDCSAISYPDGHPSNESQDVVEWTPARDHRLRRFTSLGWVVEKRKISWEKTGHVLVMDRDLGRDRHPWIVLAHEWPIADEGPSEDFKFHVPRKVEREASLTTGVFRGDKNRTPIAKIEPKNPAKDDKRPVLKQFHSGFQFLLERKGGDRNSVRTEFGPDLAHIMGWHWDAKAKQQVCFSGNGKVYMRYNVSTGKYVYPNMSHESTDGEIGFYGELRAPLHRHVGPITLEQRLADRALDDYAQQLIPRHLQSVSTSGF
ncbi:hypothetical protein P7C71_g3653, partial [Lecanoromycetidae sp. Uapishka_2]